VVGWAGWTDRLLSRGSVHDSTTTTTAAYTAACSTALDFHLYWRKQE
jgi:hypothetical protein